ncbi:MAG: DUF4091 domain-containing protein, partial [Clostridia bacterium]|nr:DUF4091 domain-containing protein [Clostridia bacterium]
MKRTVKIISLLLILATAFTLAACTDRPADDTSATEAAASEVRTDPQTVTDRPDTEPIETEIQETEPVTEAPPDLDGPDDPWLITFEETQILKSVSEKKDCEVSTVLDEKNGWLLKLSTTKKTTDPYAMFNYKKYVKAFGLTQIEASECKYIILKVKVENMTSSAFELFYAAGKVTGADGNCIKRVSYDNTDDGWQYIIFNMNGSNAWNGKLNALRLDFSTSAAGEGETMYIASVRFVKDGEDLSSFIVKTPSGREMTAEEKKASDELLKKAAAHAPEISNEAVTAANEDKDVTLWFDHSYVNTPAETVESNGRNTYQIKLAQNEIEGCHLMLSSKSGKKSLSLEVSDFEDGKGNKLDKEICYGYYFDDVDGKTVADPIPVLEHGFDLPANQSRMFIIKVKSKSDTPSGQYKATAVLKDENGAEIKKAYVYAYVWDFALPVASSCKTLSDLGEWAMIVGHNREATTVDGLEDDLYAIYYEYLLENKINCYTLPYAKRGAYWDDNVEKYLDDPRMTAFTLTWKTTFSEEYLQAAYNRISKKQSWLDRAYFYPDKDDEPLTVAALNNIISHAKTIKSIFGEYKMIIPIHYNAVLKTNPSVDFFKYIEDYVNVWCPHNYFFTTYKDYKADPTMTYLYYTKQLEEELGTLPERMARHQAEGDEVWWYVTRFPHDPEITLSINDESVVHRLMFWQQKLYNVDGFLYYMVNDWEDAKHWTKKHEADVQFGYNDYGNGVLIYPGGALPEYIEKYGSDGYPGPIGSLRLESVRDGVEDYDYFTLLDEIYGEGTSDLIIKRITTSIADYS